MSRLSCQCVIRKIDDGTTLASSAHLVTGFLFLIGVHVFGLCSTALITDIIQLSTGYQAPYFLTVCKPNYTSLNVSCKENSYIVEDICSGSDLTVINSGRLEMEIMKTSMLVFLLFINSLGYHHRHTLFNHNDLDFIFLFNSVISLGMIPQKPMMAHSNPSSLSKFQPRIHSSHLHITKPQSCSMISSILIMGLERKKVKSLSCVQLFETPWTVAHQAPPSMEFSRQECWGGLPFPSPGALPNPGIELWVQVITNWFILDVYS